MTLLISHQPLWSGSSYLFRFQQPAKGRALSTLGRLASLTGSVRTRSARLGDSAHINLNSLAMISPPGCLPALRLFVLFVLIVSEVQLDVRGAEEELHSSL